MLLVFTFNVFKLKRKPPNQVKRVVFTCDFSPLVSTLDINYSIPRKENIKRFRDFTYLS
jgi:hypothetical protein